MENNFVIKVTKGGPLLVAGEFKLVLSSGEEKTMDKAALCRCGASKNKPFCDGSHTKIHFDE